MPKLSDLRNARHVRAEDLRDPEIRAEYERTALAHAVAMRVLKYRTDHRRATRTHFHACAGVPEGTPGLT